MVLYKTAVLRGVFDPEDEPIHKKVRIYFFSNLSREAEKW